MCLYQPQNDRSFDSGRLCVRQMPFFLPTTTIGELQADGVLGLAPSLEGRSYIEQLYKGGEIEKMLVGLNFEDPANRQAVSTITFGYWDESNIEGGEEALDYYPNIGHEQWGVVLSSMSYGGEELRTRGG